MPSARPAGLRSASTVSGPLRPQDPRRVGGFRIHGLLGAGAMGTVYLGADRRGRRVAIKFLRDEYTDDRAFRTRFRREVAAASQVRSRWTARLVDADADADPPWLATEYVEGPTVSQAVDHGGAFGRDVVLDLVRGVARALDEIHAAGLVHRDVKPGNVILGPDGPRLIDLGVVGIHDATRLTTTGTPVGTPACMSPEQASAGEVTSSSDLWSLAVLAYFAATGTHLYTGQNPAVLLYQVVHEQPSLADAPDYLRPLLDACLRREPGERPTAARVLELVGSEETGAAARAGAERAAAVGPRPGSARGVTGWSGRRGAVVAAALVAFALSTAGLVAWAPWVDGERPVASDRFVAGTETVAARGVGRDEKAPGRQDPAFPGVSPSPGAGRTDPEPSVGPGDGTGTTAPGTTPSDGPTTTPGGSAPPADEPGTPDDEAPDGDDPATPPAEGPGPVGEVLTFVHSTAGRCLSDTAGGNPVLSACADQASWESTTGSGGADQLRHPGTGECLSVDGSRNVTSAACDGSALQSWRVVDYGERYGLQNAGSGECLTVLPTHDVATVSESRCGERAGQLWTRGG